MAKFSLSAENLTVFEDYLRHLDDDRVLLAMYNAQPKQLSLLRKNLANPLSTSEPKDQLHQPRCLTGAGATLYDIVW